MGIDRYDPDTAPDPAAWLALDETQRTALIENHHVETGVQIEGMHLHAMLHMIVENQIAMGEETPVRDRVRQLMAQGVSRHEAIHAISYVLLQHLNDIHRDVRADADTAGADTKASTARYYQALKRIDANKWRKRR